MDNLARLNRRRPGAAAEILKFLREAPLYDTVTAGGRDFILCHAGLGNFRPDKLPGEYTPKELLWTRPSLDDDYFDDGFPIAKTPDGRQIVFTRKDVREIQLAKAAIRAGLETLILRYGIEKEDVAKVYVAGGFGYKLNIAKAIAIGMFPAEFADRIEAVGNSSLAGAAKYLQEKDGEEIIAKLVDISTEIGLSSDKDFNEFYMDYMFFEEEE